MMLTNEQVFFISFARVRLSVFLNLRIRIFREKLGDLTFHEITLGRRELPSLRAITMDDWNQHIGS